VFCSTLSAEIAPEYTWSSYHHPWLSAELVRLSIFDISVTRDDLVVVDEAVN
jgi:hypothetical protein